MLTLYLAVTADEYELPVYVTTSVPDMAKWHGVTPDAIYSALYRSVRDAARKKQCRPVRPVRFYRVEVDDDDE